MDCRFIQEIGVRVKLRTYWGEKDECPGRYYHNTEKFIKDFMEVGNFTAGGSLDNYEASEFPDTCEYCGAKAPENAIHQVFKKRLYNTDSGKPEPGDMYYAPWYHEKDWKKGVCPWDNCNDPRGHLLVILPNGHEWDTDSRASNCTMKEDRQHRCWVKQGEPPHIHIDKDGNTCAAGAGSILSGDYHGFLHHGKLTSC